MSAAYFDALVHYRTTFPDLESLGTGDPHPDTWKTELDRVSAPAFDALLATSVNLEGGSVQGQVNFGQLNMVRALYARRAELDDTYTNPYTEPAALVIPGKQHGSLIRL